VDGAGMASPQRITTPSPAQLFHTISVVHTWLSDLHAEAKCQGMLPVADMCVCVHQLLEQAQK